MSGSLYVLALAGAALGALAGDPRLPGLLALLCVALFPVARPLAECRGLARSWVGVVAERGWSGVWRRGWRRPARMGAWIVCRLGLCALGSAAICCCRAGMPAGRAGRWRRRFWPLLGLVGVLGGGTVGVDDRRLLARRRTRPDWRPTCSCCCAIRLGRAWPGWRCATLTASGLLASGLRWSGSGVAGGRGMAACIG
ncbi:MAG: hypothetical protein MZU84_05375 [Sphingobacterium sp.]|nr:hypothetical protein [Sphingobacterium sp.]